MSLQITTKQNNLKNLLFLILCLIPINESYYNVNRNNDGEGKYRTNDFWLNKEYQAKITRPETSFWQKPTSLEHLLPPLYSRTSKSQNSMFSNRLNEILPQDLLGQETLEASNSIWGEAFNHDHNIGLNPKEEIGDESFETNVSGLVDDWIYSDYDQYDDYEEYQAAIKDDDNYQYHYTFSNMNPKKQHNTDHSSSGYQKNQLKQQNIYQNPFKMKADRRADHIHFIEEFDGLNNAAQENLEVLGFKNEKWNPRKRKEGRNFKSQSPMNDDIEGKQIISGIDINPLTSNALMGFTKQPTTHFHNGKKQKNNGWLENVNNVFSNLERKTGEMKKSFDRTILNIGDSMVGREKKKGAKEFARGVSETLNEINDHSINTKVRKKFKNKNLSSIGRFNDMKRSSPHKESERKDRKEGKNKKLVPKLFQKLKKQAKGMGSYVLKKTKQILVEQPSKMLNHPPLLSSSATALKENDASERQGLTSVFLFNFQLILLVVVEVVSMGIQSALQINQSNPTAEPTTTQSTTKGI